MAIRKPSVSVEEARRRSSSRPGATTHGDAAYSEVPAFPVKQIPQADRPQPASDAIAIGSPLEPPAAEKNEAEAPCSRKHQPPVSMLVREPAPEPKEQVFLNALLPASGVSVTFDLLCRQYRPAKALQMILRRAMDDYEEMLSDGSFSKAQAVYPVADASACNTVVQTSRMMSVRLITVARDYFDPLGLESTRAFGRKLASAALAAFFDAECERKR